MSAFLSHLTNISEVDQAILTEDNRVVILRFCTDWDPSCKTMDELLHSISDTIKTFSVIYLVDITQVPEFIKMYELYDPCTIIFLYRSKHIMADLSNGTKRKAIWKLKINRRWSTSSRSSTVTPERSQNLSCHSKIPQTDTDFKSQQR